MDLLLNALKLSFVGTCLYMDRTHAFQFMVSRPVVAAPIVGIFTGNFVMALFIGAVIELMWIREIPIGAVVPPDETTLASLVASVGILNLPLDSRHNLALYMYALIIFLPTAYVTPLIDAALRNVNNRFWHAAHDSILHNRLARIPLYHWAGALTAFFVYFITHFAFLLSGLLLISLTFDVLPPLIKAALFISGCLAPIVGIGAALSTMRGKWALVIFCATFLGLFIISI